MYKACVCSDITSSEASLKKVIQPWKAVFRNFVEDLRDPDSKGSICFYVCVCVYTDVLYI